MEPCKKCKVRIELLDKNRKRLASATSLPFSLALVGESCTADPDQLFLTTKKGTYNGEKVLIEHTYDYKASFATAEEARAGQDGEVEISLLHEKGNKTHARRLGMSILCCRAFFPDCSADDQFHFDSTKFLYTFKGGMSYMSAAPVNLNEIPFVARGKIGLACYGAPGVPSALYGSHGNARLVAAGIRVGCSGISARQSFTTPLSIQITLPKDRLRAYLLQASSSLNGSPESGGGSGGADASAPMPP